MSGCRGLDFCGCGVSVSGVLGCSCCCCNMCCGGGVIGCRGPCLLGTGGVVDEADVGGCSCRCGDVNGGYAVILSVI